MLPRTTSLGIDVKRLDRSGSYIEPAVTFVYNMAKRVAASIDGRSFDFINCVVDRYMEFCVQSHISYEIFVFLF